VGRTPKPAVMLAGRARWLARAEGRRLAGPGRLPSRRPRLPAENRSPAWLVSPSRSSAQARAGRDN